MITRGLLPKVGLLKRRRGDSVFVRRASGGGTSTVQWMVGCLEFVNLAKVEVIFNSIQEIITCRPS